MATQTPAEVKSVLSAYVFVMEDRCGVSFVGTIAQSRAEAEAQLKKQYFFLEEVSFSSCAFAVMQPAMIARYEKEKQWGPEKRIEEKGYYAFLEGMFFGAYGDKRIVSECAKRKTSDGFEAIIYRDNHWVKPL